MFDGSCLFPRLSCLTIKTKTIAMSNTTQAAKTAHGKTLEPKLRKVHTRMSKMNVNEDLFTIIHRPGWTTPAELFFVTQLIEQIERTQDLLDQQLGDLYR